MESQETESSDLEKESDSTEEYSVQQNDRARSKKKIRGHNSDHAYVFPYRLSCECSDDSESSPVFYATVRFKECKKSTDYECFVCSKTFDSYQALGGHMASHSRSGSKKAQIESRNIAETNNKVHECKSCSKTFTSPQGLGAHMKSHYRRRAKMMHIDLNLHPNDDADSGDLSS